MGRKLWVFSLDALGDIDSAVFETLPGFKRVMKEGVYVPHMRGVYPTLTYPSHASIISGRPPKSTGIINNRRFEPGSLKHDWFWYERDIKGDTLFKSGIRAGKKIAAFLWPVSASANITSNFAEIFPTKPGQKQAILTMKNSTLRTAIPIELKFGKCRRGVEEPFLDDYTMNGTRYILDKIDPDMMFIHILDVDVNKHEYGTDTKETRDAVTRVGQRIEQILDWRDHHYMSEHIDVVFLSDHSQINTPNMIYPLTDFEEEGWLKSQDGCIASYKAAPHSAGGSCYVYLNTEVENDEELQARLKDDLAAYMKAQEGIETIYYQPEIEEMGADPEAFAMLEAKEGYEFSEFFEGTELAIHEKQTHLANHGFHPDKPNYNAVFMATGPSFKKGFVDNERGSLLNIAPTLAKIQNIDLKDPVGHVMENLLI